jgi:hypothetical protein
VGAVVTLRGTINDSDPVHGTFVLQVNWDDGSAPEVFSFAAKPSREIAVTHVFQAVGQHTVHLIWRDENPLLGFGPALSDDLTVNWDPCQGACA